MEVSIGIMAYNEESNIEKLLLDIQKQKLNKISINDIIIVSSGSTDNTNKIVKDFSKKNKKTILIKQKERKGKYSAINLFLKKASSEILVLCSSDLKLKEDAIEKLCIHFNNKSIGIVSSRPIPINDKNSFVGYTVNLQWYIHHKISLSKPKFGELIAFRKLFGKIKETAVDEEHIAMLILNKFKMKGHYAKDAIIYNKGPETLEDMIRQQRRIHAGHLALKNKTGYQPSSDVKYLLLKTIISEPSIIIKGNIKFIFAVCMRLYSRLLGFYDAFIKKENHFIWEIAKSTKLSK
jgi:glycosyltransferase involved in cell wall biosynthesis